jgi:phage-related protein
VINKVGYALYTAQAGGKYISAKPLKGIGTGVMEIVSDYDTNTYRTVYTVNIGKNIYVLHAFQKKSKSGIATPKQEIDLVIQRLKMAQEIEKSKNND